MPAGGEVSYIYFVGFKLNCFTPLQICQSYILRMEISIRTDGFFKIHSKMWVNLINLVKQQIIVKAWSFTYNRLRHSMEIKKSLPQTPSLS